MLLRNFAKSVALTALFLSNLMVAEEQQRLRYAVIYSDPDGRTRFRDEFFPRQKTQSSDPKRPGMQTPFVDAQKLGFLTLPRGYSSEWHRHLGNASWLCCPASPNLRLGPGSGGSSGQAMWCWLPMFKFAGTSRGSWAGRT
jgi:hypothetical protein